MVLVDTSLWVALIRESVRDPLSLEVERLLNGGEAAWCPPVRMELWPCARSKRELDLLEQLSMLVIDLEISSEVWEEAIRLATRARGKGVNCPFPDLLIMACARVYAVELKHRDKHFELLAKL